MTTKGIAQQLRDGSAQLDEMKRDIFATVRIIREQFQKHDSEYQLRTVFEYTCHKITGGQEYRWIVCTYNTGVTNASVTCRHFADIGSRAELVNDHVNKIAPSIEHIQGIYDSLDEFVDAVFAKFPEMKTDLRPLLDAGA